MKSPSAMLALLSLLLFASTMEARNEPGIYRKTSDAKDDQAVPEANYGFTPWSSAPKNSYDDQLFKSSSKVRIVANDNTKTPESDEATPEMITIVIHVKIPTSLLKSYNCDSVPKGGDNPSPYYGRNYAVPHGKNPYSPFNGGAVPQGNYPSFPFNNGFAVPKGTYNNNGDAVPQGNNPWSPYNGYGVPKGNNPFSAKVKNTPAQQSPKNSVYAERV